MQGDKNTNNRIIEQTQAHLYALESKLDAIYSQMGKAVLQCADTASRHADVLTAQIVNTRKDLARLCQDQRCPDCQANSAITDRYCRNCGTKLIYKEKEHEPGQ